jgi:hypothetical protein
VKDGSGDQFKWSPNNLRFNSIVKKALHLLF